jgi:hypothetical protein
MSPELQADDRFAGVRSAAVRARRSPTGSPRKGPEKGRGELDEMPPYVLVTKAD